MGRFTVSALCMLTFLVACGKDKAPAATVTTPATSTASTENENLRRRIDQLEAAIRAAQERIVSELRVEIVGIREEIHENVNEQVRRLRVEMLRALGEVHNHLGRLESNIVFKVQDGLRKVEQLVAERRFQDAREAITKLVDLVVRRISGLVPQRRGLPPIMPPAED